MIINSVIKSGSAPAPTSGFTVRYIDYDGTILKTQHVSAGGYSTHPNDPVHTGLTFQYWGNATIGRNIQADLDIGATYIPTDGKTHAFIRTTVTTGLDLVLFLNKSDGSTLTVDWGDSSSGTFTNTGNFNTGTHTYASEGDYEITLEITSGTGTYGLENASSGKAFCGGATAIQRDMLQDIWVGSDVTSIGDYAFYSCYSLASIVIPSSVTSIGNYAFQYCYSLASVVIPNGVTSIGTNVFRYCYSLASVVIPSGVTSIGNYAFQNCYALPAIVIPSGVTSIGDYSFQSCYALPAIVIPSGVTSIGTNAFQACYATHEYHFESTMPPTLGDTIFLNLTPSTKIFVPTASLDDYKVATNWVTYADYIYGE